MSSKTKIIVLHMKEVIYTGIFLLLLVIFGVVMLLMFGPGKSETASSDTVSKYTPGIYRTSIRLNNNSFDVEVTVDQDSIRSIHLANLSESTSAMFPLVEPVLDQPDLFYSVTGKSGVFQRSKIHSAHAYPCRR